MLQLCYVSTAAPGSMIDVDALLSLSRTNNRRAGLTGLLIHDGRRFLQVLEGDERAVIDTFERIRGDPRHRAIVTISAKSIKLREFGDWSMASSRIDPVEPGDTLADTVAAMTESLADANLKALLRGFAQIDRAAA